MALSRKAIRDSTAAATASSSSLGAAWRPFCGTMARAASSRFSLGRLHRRVDGSATRTMADEGREAVKEGACQRAVIACRAAVAGVMHALSSVILATRFWIDGFSWSCVDSVLRTNSPKKRASVMLNEANDLLPMICRCGGEADVSRREREAGKRQGRTDVEGALHLVGVDAVLERREQARVRQRLGPVVNLGDRVERAGRGRRRGRQYGDVVWPTGR